MAREAYISVRSEGREYYMGLKNKLSLIGNEQGEASRNIVKYVRLHETFGWASGVKIDSEMHVLYIRSTVKESINILSNIDNSIIFVDIDYDTNWLTSKELLRIAERSNNFFVLVTERDTVKYLSNEHSVRRQVVKTA